MKNRYCPEGLLLNSRENTEYLSSLDSLERAMTDGKILESTVLLCDSSLSLHLDLGGVRGIIRKEECVWRRDGEALKEIAIITRVGKPVCFKVIGIEYSGGVPIAILSRRAAQLECAENYISTLTPGDVIDAVVTHMESFGAFVDIGCGISSLLSVDSISVSRISHPSERLYAGEQIHAVVKSIDPDTKRVFLSMRELLGTWSENVTGFEAGQTVAGIVRSVESYGIFVELAPNLAGLAEIREGSQDAELAKVGARVAVYIKSIIPDRMKIKLVIIDAYKGTPPTKRVKYFTDTDAVRHIDYWRYSPEGNVKVIESVF
jgi:small subunit ribosomal protein S1